jgi:hypothetical protein
MYFLPVFMILSLIISSPKEILGLPVFDAKKNVIQTFKIVISYKVLRLRQKLIWFYSILLIFFINL